MAWSTGRQLNGADSMNPILCKLHLNNQLVKNSFFVGWLLVLQSPLFKPNIFYSKRDKVSDMNTLVDSL